MNINKIVKHLCKPAYVYLIISMLSMFILMVQNFGNTNKYCVSKLSCYVSSLGTIFIAKMIYISFWTFVLHNICKAGYKNIAWVLALLPFIMLGIFVIIFVIKGSLIKK